MNKIRNKTSLAGHFFRMNCQPYPTFHLMICRQCFQGLWLCRWCGCGYASVWVWLCRWCVGVAMQLYGCGYAGGVGVAMLMFIYTCLLSSPPHYPPHSILLTTPTSCSSLPSIQEVPPGRSEQCRHHGASVPLLRQDGTHEDSPVRPPQVPPLPAPQPLPHLGPCPACKGRRWGWGAARGDRDHAHS